MRIKPHLISRSSSHILCYIFLIVCSASAALAENTIIFYRDGALLQQEAGAVKGVIVIPISAGLLEHSLTIIPSPGTTILGVETENSASDRSSDKGLDALAEQRRRLEDRLLALETREAIFTSAAKAQSGKPPRKTKANPDPMLAIRQGTNFAIAQLEAVYTARRTTTQEIRNIDMRLATAKKNRRPPEISLRIAVTPARGRVTLRYATAERGWQSQYNLYLAGNGSAQLQLFARLTGSGHGRQVRVSSGSLAESSRVETFPVHADNVLLASYRMPMAEEHYTGGIFNHFYGKITNSSPNYLPPGDSRLFQNGVYLGKFRFEGFSSGRSTVISLGE
ncbi:MAG: hypothetical protein PHH28_05095 [Desulfuromonadaceae bacterium]|nr:hypothetical protein [Desulfuromonadaceae bacterium]